MIETFAEAVDCAEEALRDPSGMRFTHLPTLVGFVESLAGDDPRLPRSNDAVRLGELLLELGLRNEAQRLFRLLAAFERDTERFVRAPWVNSVAVLGASLGLLDETYELLSDSRGVLPGGPQDRAATLANLAAVALGRGDSESARDHATKARIRFEKLNPERYPALYELLADIELRLARATRTPNADRVLTDALARRVEELVATVDAHGPRAFLAVADLGMAQVEAAVEASDAAGLESAVMVMEVVSQRMSALLGADHPAALGVRADLAAAQIEEARTAKSPARLQRAVHSLERVQERLETRLGPAHPRSVAALTNLVTAQVDVLRATGERGEAERVAEHLEERATHMEELLGTSHPATRLVRASSVACRRISREEGGRAGAGGDTMLLTRTEAGEEWPRGRYRSYRDAVREMEDDTSYRAGTQIFGQNIGHAVVSAHTYIISSSEEVLTGGLPTVRQADPLVLGVRPAHRVGAGRLPPYVQRDVDHELMELMRPITATGGLVVLVGEPLSGKSRTAWEAVVSAFPPETRVYAPAPGDGLRHPLTFRGRDTLIWLDGLEDHLQGQGQNAELLARLVRSPVPVVATLSDEAYAALRMGGGPAMGALIRADIVEVALRWSEAECARLARMTDLRLADALRWGQDAAVAEFLATGPVLWEELRRTQFTHPHGHLIVRAAIDLARCGVSSPVTSTALETVAGAYEERTVGVGVEGFEAGIAWAGAPRLGASGLLVSGEEQGTWRAPGALIARASRSRAMADVPGLVWRRVLNGVGRGEFPNGAAVTAQALAEFEPRAEAGEAAAMYMLAEIAEAQGTGDAEHWYRKAVEAGKAGVSGSPYGRLLSGENSVPDAIRYLEKAAAGHRPVAASELGRLLLDHAGHWLRAAAEAGDTEAAEIVARLWPDS